MRPWTGAARRIASSVPDVVLRRQHGASGAVLRSGNGDARIEDQIAIAKASPTPWAPQTEERRNKPGTDTPTQLIFNLYNRGEGWGEEIVPHITVEQRELKARQRKQSERWEVRPPRRAAPIEAQVGIVTS
jgi:hypothetical protein